MGLRHIIVKQQTQFYMNLTPEEKGRMHPWTRAKCVMMSGDSPVIGTSLHHPSRPDSYDLPDEARPGHINPVIPLVSVGKLNPDQQTNPEAIEEENEKEREELTPSTKKRKSSPESQSRTERNGVKCENKTIDKTFKDYEDDDACIKCIYVSQQFCECIIL